MFSVFTNPRGALPSGRWSSHPLLSLQSVLRTPYHVRLRNLDPSLCAASGLSGTQQARTHDLNK
jgi:hypothetical protein